MNVVLLKNTRDKVNIKEQQNKIIRFAKAHHISLDSTEIESSNHNLILEERQEFKGFLRSFSVNDSILVYDLWTFTDDAGELTKILKCLFERNILVYLCKDEVLISKNTSLLDALTLLSNFREKAIFLNKTISQGRPKGRMSKSKFDINRKEIVEYLIQKESVSAISKTLGVSRTSLKDYINSRGLKDLAQAKTSLLGSKIQPKVMKKVAVKAQRCSLINRSKEKHDVSM